SIVELTVIVYSGRPAAALEQAENAYAVDFVKGSNTVRVYYSGQLPTIRVGGWILDATMVGPPVLGSNHPLPEPHGYFYRVVSLTEGRDGQGPYVDLELQTPLKAGVSTPQLIGQKTGVLVVLEGVAEVFEKGSGWRP